MTNAFPVRILVAAAVVAFAGMAGTGLTGEGALGQERPTEATARTETTTPQRQYGASWLHRLFLGGLNRDLWELEVEAEVLDLSTHGGGLTPLRRGGGLQTASLRFRGGDGQVYTFRSIDKDATRNLDPLLRESIAASVLQDQIAALLPVSAMVVAPLLDAAGVLHADPELVVMPSDARLGEFRDDFAGLLGWIEVRPDEGPDGEPGFAGSDRVTGSDRFREELEQTPNNRVNAPAYLRARLMDLFVGDWDRHPDQWRWAAFEEDDDLTRWEPIPRDRDWALSHIDGLLFRLARPAMPHYVGFSASYESVFGTTWNGRALDRRLLSELTRGDWEATAADLQSRLTDDVIAEAVATLPAPYAEAVGVELEGALTARRDKLMEAALEFYVILSGWVDVYGTDKRDLAVVERLEGGATRVRLYPGADEEREPYFDRVLDHADTRELRVFLRGGDDHLVVRGQAEPRITIRAIGGGRDDTFEDNTTGERVHFYDDRGDNNFFTASRTSVDESDYREPEDTESATHQARPRDWGTRWFNLPMIGANSDVGIFAGQVLWRETYGFRHFPYQTRATLTYTVNPIVLGVAGKGTYEFPLRRGTLFGVLEVEGSTRDVRYHYGFGNETGKDRSSSFFRADRAYASVFTPLEIRTGGDVLLRLGPAAGFSTPVDEDDQTFITNEPPYGYHDFSWAGLRGGIRWDSRDVEGFASKGGLIEIDGRLNPAILDVDESYGGVRGSASLNVSLGRPVASFKVVGEKVWGDFPYFDGALLGGAASLRGFTKDRFVGDAAVLGSAQLRLPLTDFMFLLPGTLGIHALVDIGRVYLDDESSDDWHAAWGGGIWASFLKPEYTIGVLVAHSNERTGLYLGLGLGY